MDEILKQLYKGGIFPEEQWHASSEEFKELRKRQRESNGEFIEELNAISPELAEKFTDILDGQIEMLAYEAENTFVQAFKLGAKLMLETFS